TLEDGASLAIPVEDRLHGVVARQDKAVVHAQVPAEILAGFGLDVVDRQLAAALDARDLEPLPVQRGTAGLLEGSLQLRDLDRIEEADLVGEDPAVTCVLDAYPPQVVAVLTALGLVADRREDPESA